MSVEMARSAAVWDPGQYLRFAGERLRPALDLLAHVPLDAPARVVDLGCGTGNVTAILRARFPAADIVGVDGSATMLEKARATVPECRFEQGDFFSWQPTEPVDLIYSNAALHWVDGHPTLFPQLLSFLAPGGVLAVQMPDMFDTPLRQIPYQLAESEAWRSICAVSRQRPAFCWRTSTGTCFAHALLSWISGGQHICIRSTARTRSWSGLRAVA
jgi:trans-aconitate 2-methyltransferase